MRTSVNHLQTILNSIPIGW